MRIKTFGAIVVAVTAAAVAVLPAPAGSTPADPATAAPDPASSGPATAPAAEPVTADPATPDPDEPVILNAGAPDAVPDRYVVVLRGDGQDAQQVAATAAALTQQHGGQVRHTYGAALDGYSAEMTAEQAVRVAREPGVRYVQQVSRMVAVDTQEHPPNWGDDRIDQLDLPLDHAYTHPAAPGRGARVYVLDTGLNAAHEDFAGRVGEGFDAVDRDTTPQDCHGHGTHVAGTAAGAVHGVAKEATVVPVRVLDCGGRATDDDLLAGIDWVKANAARPAVVNFSIGCRQRCADQALDDAVRSVIAGGVPWVQAAGNAADDACHFSPQHLPEGITVGNSTRSDGRQRNSNQGACLDLFAPGTDIVSAVHTAERGSTTMTGTSMASPHVAGAVALYLARHPYATPAQARDALVAHGSSGKVGDAGSDSPNVLLHTAFLNGCAPVTDDTDRPTTAGGAVESAVTVAGCAGNASATASVSVAVTHTDVGDLVVSLVAPDGGVHVLHDRADAGTGELRRAYTVDLSGHVREGTWTLRVADAGTGGSGKLDSWTLAL
ncbi:S8 family peptidase [Saccharothrix australiensis]|uniref:Subtilisin family serine protease n=1 Tax=Saccharothrix australiensis TaxID=2072 RepID=A0A495W5L7_9PSEU|nr:S8 family serine peptidase [Saccharothrix australiensis]RKT56729.1 subtilisin family serine protease [Saccharothrix australiensis]